MSASAFDRLEPAMRRGIFRAARAFVLQLDPPQTISFVLSTFSELGVTRWTTFIRQQCQYATSLDDRQILAVIREEELKSHGR